VVNGRKSGSPLLKSQNKSERCGKESKSGVDVLAKRGRGESPPTDEVQAAGTRKPVLKITVRGLRISCAMGIGMRCIRGIGNNFMITIPGVNEYHKKMIEQLKQLEKVIEAMPSEEFLRLFEESKVTEEEASYYAPLEKMLMGETVDGWKLAE